MKRVLTLVLALSLANVARAADDAPLLMQPGDVAPSAGVWLPNELAVRRAQELTRLRAENQSLKDSAGVPVALVVGLVVAGVVAGGFAGYGVARAVSTPR